MSESTSNNVNTKKIINIKLAKHQDAENLAALSTLVWLHTYSTDGINLPVSQYVHSNFTIEKMSQLISKKDWLVYCAFHDGNLIGYITVNKLSEFKNAKHEIETLYIHPLFHKLGVGKMLVEEARRQVDSSIWLSVWSLNENALGFYKRMGFKKIGKRDFILDGQAHENTVLAIGDNI